MARGAESLKLRSTRPDKSVGLCRTNKTFAKECEDMLKNVRNLCEIDSGDNKKFRGKRERLNRRRKRGKKQQVRNMTWKDKHCKKLLLNIRGDELEKRIDQLSTSAEEMRSDLFEIAKDAGWTMVGEAAAKYGGKAAARHGAATLVCGGAGATAGSIVPVAGTAAGGTAGAVVCNVGALIVDVGSGLWTVWDTWSNISDIKELVEDAYEQLGEAMDTAKRVQEVIDDPTKIDQLKKDVMDEMVKAATTDPCIRARKCFLVPYSPTKQGTYGQGGQEKNLTGGTKKGIFDTGPMNLGDSRGCCPGQTGHHLIQDAWLKNKGSERGAGDLCGAGKYNVDAAPVVCVEGMDQNTGSHGEIHDQTKIEVQRQLDKPPPLNSFSMSDAINVAADAHAESVGGKCNKDCIKKQLTDFYGGMGCNPRPTDKNGQTMAPSEGGSSGGDDF